MKNNVSLFTLLLLINSYFITIIDKNDMEKKITITANENYSNAVNNINKATDDYTRSYLDGSRKRISAAMEEMNATKKLFDIYRQNISQQTQYDIKWLSPEFKQKEKRLREQWNKDELDSLRKHENEIKKIKQQFKNDEEQRNKKLDIENSRFLDEENKRAKDYQNKITLIETEKNKKRVELLKQENRKFKQLEEQEGISSEYDRRFGGREYIESIRGGQGMFSRMFSGDTFVEKTLKKDRKALDDNYKKDVEQINKKYSSLDKNIENETKRKKELLDIDNKYRENINKISSAENELNNKREKISSGGGRGRGGRNWWSAGEIGVNTSIMGISNALSSGNVYGAAVNTGGALLSSTAGMIPVVGNLLGTAISGITQIMSSAVNQYLQSEVGTLLSNRMTGRNTAFGAIGNLMTADKYVAFERQFAQQRGGVGNNMQTVNELMLERALGYDFGSFSGLNRFQRYMPQGTTTNQYFEKFIKQAAASDLWNVKSKDFSAMGTVLNQVAIPLLSMESAFFDSIKGGRTRSLITNFAGLGGGWADPNTMMNRIGAIDTGLRSPTNSFADQLIKSAIIKNNPSVSLMNLMDIQAQGIMNPNTLTSLLKGMSGLSSENQHLTLMNMFPSLRGSYEARSALLAHPEFASKAELTEKEAMQLGISRKDWTRMMSGLTGMGEGVQNQILNWLKDEGGKIVKVLNDNMPQIKEILNVTQKVVTGIFNIVKSIDNYFKPATPAEINKVEMLSAMSNSMFSKDWAGLQTMTKAGNLIDIYGAGNKNIGNLINKYAPQQSESEYLDFVKEVLQTKKEIENKSNTIIGVNANKDVFNLLRESFKIQLENLPKTKDKEKESKELDKIIIALNQIIEANKFSKNDIIHGQYINRKQ